MRYYWCVNCGYSHDFGKDKKRGVSNCVNCEYDDLTELEEDEWQERFDRILLKNKHILGDGRTFIGEQPKKTKEDIEEILRQIKEGTYAVKSSDN